MPALLRTIALAGLALLLSTPGQAMPDCRDAGYMASFEDDRIVPQDCTEIERIEITWGGGTSILRVLKTADTSVARGNAMTALLRAAVARIGTAMDAIGGLQLADITILVTNLARPSLEGVSADAYAVTADKVFFNGECLIPFYAVGDFGELASRDFEIAHEIFHCVQYSSWRDGMRVPGYRWWAEGSATYFAELAGSGNTGTADGVRGFDEASPERSLLDMTYENVVFFAWLGDRFGPPRLKSFLDRAALGRSVSDQRLAAAQALATEGWKDFATAYLGGEIRLPGGRPLGSTARFPTEFSTESGGEFHLVASPLVVYRARLYYRPAGKYRTSVRPRFGRYAAARSDDPHRWADLPETHDIGCDQEPEYTLAAMSAGTSGVEIAIRVEAGDRYDCTACSGERLARDRCLVGTWQESGNNAAEWSIRALEQLGRMVDFEPGDRGITFTADGGLSAHMDGMHATVEASLDPAMVMTVEQRFDHVEVTAFWSAERGQLSVCNVLSGGSGSTRSTIAGKVTEKPLNIPPNGDDTVFSYSCSGDTARIEVPTSSGPLVVNLRRVRP